MKEKLLSVISDWATRKDANRAIGYHKRAIARRTFEIGVFRSKIHPKFYKIAFCEEEVDEHRRAIRAINGEFGMGTPDRLESETA